MKWSTVIVLAVITGICISVGVSFLGKEKDAIAAEKEHDPTIARTIIVYDRWIETIEHSGHRYVMGYSSGVHGRGVSMLHDPDCSCGKAK